MKPATGDINRELLELTESFANGDIDPAEFRRQRRELVCEWTGEPAPQLDQELPDEDDTQPALKPITDKDIADAKPSDQPAGAPPPVRQSLRGWWITAVLLLVAAAGAGALLWFILRRSV